MFMSKKEVVDLMASSTSEDQWQRNCSVVRERCGGYPDFWHAAIINSGLRVRVAASWGGNSGLHVKEVEYGNG
jgi:hypothetical protein